MVKSNWYKAIKLYKLVQKNYNGSTSIVVEDVLGNIVESLYNLVLIRRDNYTSLLIYLEVSKYRTEVLEELGFNIVGSELWNKYINKLDNHSLTSRDIYRKFEE